MGALCRYHKLLTRCHAQAKEQAAELETQLAAVRGKLAVMEAMAAAAAAAAPA